MQKTILPLFPGALVCLTIAAAATFLSEHYHAPVMLLALLLGMALGHLASEERTASGIQFVARTVLRIGVALLGLRVTLAQVASLGWEPFALVVATLAVTIVASVFVARAMGFNPLFGFLSGGATAICGASAALAIAAALQAHPGKERATSFTIIGVSALSTLAMIVYPMIAHALHFDDRATGIFLGATIHDVAQVVGAGYSVSPLAGDTATIVKLTRVAMLLPVIMVAALITRSSAAASGERPPLIPWFAAGFVALMAVNSLGWAPKFATDASNEISRWCLAAAIAAIGMKTSLRDLISVGPKPIALMVLETTFLVLIVLGAMTWLM